MSTKRRPNLRTMITQQQIDDTVEWDGLKEFGRFVLSHCKDRGLPDYKKMDLIQIPRLVPHIFVLDEREFDTTDKLVFNFAGGELTKTHGKALLGEDARAVYESDQNFEEISKLYRKSINDKLVSYTKRYSELVTDYGGSEWKTTEALFFPCSSNGANVDWGVGCVHYDVEPTNGENIFLHF